MKLRGWEKLKATNFWQAAFVRPFEDKANWKRFMSIWMFYGFGLVLTVTSISMLIDDVMSWPVPLEQMQKTSGILSSVEIQLRGPSYLVVTTPGRNEERFFARWLPGTNLRAQVGRRVTVWSKDGFELFYGRVRIASEVKLDDGGDFVLGYSARRPEGVAFDKKDHYWFLAIFTLGLFLIIRPVWKFWKPIEKPQQLTERGE